MVRLLEELAVIGLGFPRVDPTADLQLGQEIVQHALQAPGMVQGPSQEQGILPDHPAGLGQAPLQTGPTPEHQAPVLDDQADELGIELTEDAIRLGTARLVQLALTLPELEEQLD